MGNTLSGPDAEEIERQKQHKQDGESAYQRRSISSLSTQELLNNLENECDTTLSTIQNLKIGRNFDQGTRGYIYSIMRDTEEKLHNFNLSMPPVEANGGSNENQNGTTKLASCCEETLRRSDGEIKQLKSNNETLLQKGQKAELQIQELQRKLAEYDKAKHMSRKDEGVSEHSAAQENESSKQSNESNLKPNADQSSPKDHIVQNLQKQIKGLEEDLKGQQWETKEQCGILTLQKEDLEKHVKKLEKEMEILLLSHRKSEDISEHSNVQGRENSTQPNDSNLKQTLEQCKEDKLSPKDHIQSLQTRVRGMEYELMRQKLEAKEQCDMLTAQNETFEIHVKNLEKEKDGLLLRLSKFAGERLVENNPAIADLSDPNRPTKLGEMYSEIYDNEWTDAFEALKDAGYEEETAIETLRMTLENVLKFCESKADLVLLKASDAVNLLFEEYRHSVIEMKVPSHLTMPRAQSRQLGQVFREKSSLEEIMLQQKWKPKHKQQMEDTGEVTKQSSKQEQKEGKPKFDAESKLKHLRKEVATSMVPVVQKAYIEASWSNECIPALKPFIMKCLYLGWMMVVQSPPLVLHKFPSEQDAKFDKILYKEFTSSGPLVSFMVWPALLLHENGSVVGKGVAQGKKT